jgi:hypothetical protein
MVKPSVFYELIADIVTGVTKKPYRDEALTEAEIEEINYRVTVLCDAEQKKLKEKVHDAG